MIPSAPELEIALLRGATLEPLPDKQLQQLAAKPLWVLRRTWRKPVKLIETLEAASILGAEELMAEKKEEEEKKRSRYVAAAAPSPQISSSDIIREQISYAVRMFDMFSDEPLCPKKRKLVLELFL